MPTENERIAALEAVTGRLETRSSLHEEKIGDLRSDLKELVSSMERQITAQTVAIREAVAPIVAGNKAHEVCIREVAGLLKHAMTPAVLWPIVLIMSLIIGGVPALVVVADRYFPAPVRPAPTIEINSTNGAEPASEAS